MMEKSCRAVSLEERSCDHRAAAAFVDACKSGNPSALSSSVEQIESTSINGWRLAFMQAAKLENVPVVIKKAFMKIWVEDKTIRLKIGNDFLAIAGLRVLLPSYSGPDVHLFRGETFYARRRRTYGMSWTEDIATAIKFANDPRRLSIGGSVVLETIAPSTAIIAATYMIDDPYKEREYLVDRRQLKSVKVVYRYPQLVRENAKSNSPF
jgi:hypothetical protein